MTELKNCPFCGSEPELGIHNPKINGEYQVQIGCVSGNCPMNHVGGHGFATEKEAITAWNTRTDCRDSPKCRGFHSKYADCPKGGDAS